MDVLVWTSQARRGHGGEEDGGGAVGGDVPGQRLQLFGLWRVVRTEALTQAREVLTHILNAELQLVVILQ